MGRIRTIKPEFTTDEELSSLPADTHLFAAGLLCYADDEGYFNANAGLVKAAIFPLRESSVSAQEMLNQLEKIGYLKLGSTLDGKRWGQVVKFSVHQRVNRPTPSKIKDLEIQWGSSPTPHLLFSEPSLSEGKGKEVGTERKKRVDEIILPEWLPVDSWKSFIEMRKKTKKPMTERAKELAIKKLEEFYNQRYDVQIIIDAAVMNNWQGFYIPKDKDGQPIKPKQTEYEIVEVSPEKWWNKETVNVTQ